MIKQQHFMNLKEFLNKEINATQKFQRQIKLKIKRRNRYNQIAQIKKNKPRKKNIKKLRSRI